MSDRSIQALNAEKGKPKQKQIVMGSRPSGKKVFIFRFQCDKKIAELILNVGGAVTHRNVVKKRE